MGFNQQLKQELLEKLSNHYSSMSVYSIRKLTDSETEERAKYYASKFFNRNSIQPFIFHKEDYLTSVKLPRDTTMEIYHKSDTFTIEQKINSFEHFFRKKLELRESTEIVSKWMKQLGLDKYKLPIEHIELEMISEIKASGITKEEVRLPTVLCRVEGVFRRHINKIPVFGGPSIFVKIGEDVIESLKIAWRPINEKPAAEAKVIDPHIAAENILKHLASSIPEKTITTDNFKPEFFDIGYCSKPKRQEQKYMQPVYIAIFKSLGMSPWNTIIIIPATNPIYEQFIIKSKNVRS